MVEAGEREWGGHNKHTLYTCMKISKNKIIKIIKINK